MYIFGAALLELACGQGDGSSPGDGGGEGDPVCGVEQTKCGAACVDLLSNPNSCGACGVACASGEACVAGSCDCQAGLDLCASGCAALGSDGANCGACGNSCDGGLVCSQGTCGDSCLAEETQCGSSCVDVSSDALNCGACGNACGAGNACTLGVCDEPATSTGGSSGTGGAPGTGGAAASGGSETGTGGTSGVCDPGSTSTTWASSCSTTAPSCTAGTWVAGGPDPDHQNFTKCSESTHFVVYSDEACTASAQTAVNHLETVWNLYFGSPMYMREPLCNSSTKYKAAVHVHSDWGLTGGAWDGQHMGMWIGQGALNDHWGLAHEFMHGVQSVQGGQRCNQSNTCGWIYESHANWAAQQQSEYHTSEVHCSEMMANMPHLYLGSSRDRYCNWQFMEYLKDKHCFSAVNAIWTGDPAIDPLTAIRNGMGWSVAQLGDFLGEWAMHNVTWDYQDPEPQSTAGQNQGTLFRQKYGITTDTSQTIRRLRTTKVEPLDADYATNRRFVSPFHWAPQRYGYNVIRLYPEANATTVTVKFRGVTSSPASPDWRWGLVATDSGVTTPRYSALQKGSDAELEFCITAGEQIFLVVTATPSAWYNIVWDQPYNTVPRYPYMFELAGAWPEGFKQGAPDACPAGLTRATNGGGCAPSGTTAYVGPYATVLSGATVSGNARIEDHAIVANGTVTGGTVGALSLIGTAGGFGSNAFNMSSGTAKTTFYPLGFFESGQGLSGGSLIGDVEYRGGSLNRNSGTCTGFVDNGTCMGPGSDATPQGPYTWR